MGRVVRQHEKNQEVQGCYRWFGCQRNRGQGFRCLWQGIGLPTTGREGYPRLIAALVFYDGNAELAFGLATGGWTIQADIFGLQGHQQQLHNKAYCVVLSSKL